MKNQSAHFAIFLTVLILSLTYINSLESKSLEKVTFKNSKGVTIPGYLTTPANLDSTKKSHYPAVLLLHGCAGAFSYSNPEKGIASLYKRWSKELSEAGYFVMLVDSFSPRTDVQRQCGNGSAGVSETDERPHDVNAAYEFLMCNDLLEGLVHKNRVGIMGWSHGGSTVITTMSKILNSGEINKKYFQLGISYYPGCGLYGAYSGITNSTWVPYGFVQILHASEDPLYYKGYCDKRVANALTIDVNADINLKVFEGAQHSYDQQTDGVVDKFTPADKEARIASHDLVLKHFTEKLKGDVKDLVPINLVCPLDAGLRSTKKQKRFSKSKKRILKNK